MTFIKEGAKMIGKNRAANRFTNGWGSKLPDAYKKFWKEWHGKKPAPVHYIPKKGRYERNEVTGVVTPIQNVALPLRKTREEWYGIWGGEAIIQGSKKNKLQSQPIPYFWVPTLKRSVVRSEVLNEYLSTVVTDRTIRLINEHHGFDHYLLQTPACDLRSILALKIKKKILVDLLNGAPAWNHNESRQKEILDEYSKYLSQYTPEEIDWYGLTWIEALNKIRAERKPIESPIIPHKHYFRKKLIEQLNEVSADGTKEIETDFQSDQSSSWLKKLNPFAKKET